MSESPVNLYAQETETRLLVPLLPHVEKSFVDIGAEKGGFASFLIGRGFSGALFEPLPKHQPALEKLIQGTAARAFPFAIDERDGHAEFHIACDEKGDPLDYFHSLHRLENDDRVHHRQKIPVVCRSLESLRREGLVPARLGVLKTDTEGNDLRVLRGLGAVRPEIVICEFFTPGVYNGWPDAEPLGLMAEVRSRLGLARCLAIRRRKSAEVVSVDPVAFTDQEWGNLIFLSEALFQKTATAFGAVVRGVDERLFQLIEEPRKKKKRSWWRR